MSNPKWLLEIEAGKFYNSENTTCPKCHAQFPWETPSMQVLASDILFDKCPNCSTYIIINMLSGTNVIFEGFTTSDEMHSRAQTLTKT